VGTVPGNERHGLGAALEVGTDDATTAWGGLADLLGLATVVADESVGELNASADGKDVVTHTVDPEVCDGVFPAVAATDQTAGDGGNSAELASASASDGVGHAAAVGETSGEARGLVNAEVGFDLLDDGVDERDVCTASVGPAVVNAIWGNEDGGALGESLEAVPDGNAVAVDYIAHGPAKPVKAEDEAVRVARVVVVRDLEGVLTAVDGLDARGECGLTAATA